MVSILLHPYSTASPPIHFCDLYLCCHFPLLCKVRKFSRCFFWNILSPQISEDRSQSRLILCNIHQQHYICCPLNLSFIYFSFFLPPTDSYVRALPIIVNFISFATARNLTSKYLALLNTLSLQVTPHQEGWTQQRNLLVTITTNSYCSVRLLSFLLQNVHCVMFQHPFLATQVIYLCHTDLLHCSLILVTGYQLSVIVCGYFSTSAFLGEVHLKTVLLFLYYATVPVQEESSVLYYKELSPSDIPVSACCHASVEQRSARDLPEPVGDSNKQFWRRCTPFMI